MPITEVLQRSPGDLVALGYPFALPRSVGDKAVTLAARTRTRADELSHYHRGGFAVRLSEQDPARLARRVMLRLGEQLLAERRRQLHRNGP